MTTVCDVCLVECSNGGVLACRHLVCRSCGMSQNKCLVCAEVGGTARRRNLNLIRMGPRADLAHQLVPAEGSPPPQFKPQRPSPVSNSSAAARPTIQPATSRPSAPAPAVPRPPAAPDFINRSPHSPPIKVPHTPEASVSVSVSVTPSPPVSLPTNQGSRKRSASPLEDEPPPEPPLKVQRRESVSSEDPADVKVVHAPTVYDDVRMELSPLNGAPMLSRPALRTSTRLSIKLLSDFLHKTFELPISQQVVLSCAGEDLSESMTVGNLRANVWPRSEGHMLLQYRVVQNLARAYAYRG